MSDTIELGTTAPVATETNGTPAPVAGPVSAPKAKPAPKSSSGVSPKAKPRPGSGPGETGKVKPAAKSSSGASTKPAAGGKGKPAPAKAAPAATATREKKDGLRKGQARILRYLAKAPNGADRNLISAKAPCDLANCVELIGSHDPEKRALNDVKHYKSLISLGYVKAEAKEVDGRTKIIYTATAAGKKAAEKLPAE
jgi:hypothetical protein